MRFNFSYWLFGSIIDRLDEINMRVRDLQEKEAKEMATLQDLQAEVAATKRAEDKENSNS